MASPKIAIGCDEAAYDLKMVLSAFLEERGWAVQDFGTNKGETALYPDIAFRVAREVADGHFDRAVLLCGTGIGVAITANKVPGVRAAQCHDAYSAERARKSNNAQIITMGSLIVGPALARTILGTWLDSEFQGSSSTAKVQRICDYEETIAREQRERK
ncbi:MAG: RpiB/LacA/LacB family sugar-phosphate isomerase [Acidobacteriota bacterium]